MTDPRDATPAPQDGAGRTDAPEVVAPARTSAPDTPGVDWRGGLSDGLKRVAEKFASPAEIVKSYAALERRLGRSVTVPDKTAGPAEIDAFYARLGRPESPDGYEVHTPEDLPDDLRAGPDAESGRAEFLQAMHAAGATPSVVQAAFDWYYEALVRSDADRSRAAEAARAEVDAGLRRDWGPGYDRNIELARRAARQFGGEALVTAFERAGLADDPVCLQAFHRIGAALAEDGLVAGAGRPGPSAQQRIDHLMGKHFGKASYAGPEVQDELRALYQTLYGDGPAEAE